jgi:hypothetical protein
MAADDAIPFLSVLAFLLPIGRPIEVAEGAPSTSMIYVPLLRVGHVFFHLGHFSSLVKTCITGNSLHVP